MAVSTCFKYVMDDSTFARNTCTTPVAGAFTASETCKTLREKYIPFGMFAPAVTQLLLHFV